MSTLAQIALLINVVFCLLADDPIKKNLKFFRYYLLLALIVQIIAMVWVWVLHGKNNLFLLHLYTLLEFIFLSLFYKTFLIEEEKNKKKFIYFILIISGLIVFNSIRFQPLNRFNSYAKTLTQIIYIGYAIYYFFKAQNRNNITFPSIFNLLNSGILIYYAASLFIFMFSNVILELSNTHMLFWIFNSLLYLVFQLLIFYGLWKIVFRQTKFI